MTATPDYLSLLSFGFLPTTVARGNWKLPSSIAQHSFFHKFSFHDHQWIVKLFFYCCTKWKNLISFFILLTYHVYLTRTRSDGVSGGSAVLCLLNAWLNVITLIDRNEVWWGSERQPFFHTRRFRLNVGGRKSTCAWLLISLLRAKPIDTPNQPYDAALVPTSDPPCNKAACKTIIMLQN